MRIARQKAEESERLKSTLADAAERGFAQCRDLFQDLLGGQPAGASGLPVVFWIHGGGWQTGDKSSVALKPQAFVDEGFVFVSTNYRLLPGVDMETIVRDVARSIGWVSRNVAEYGGDPARLALADVVPAANSACSMMSRGSLYSGMPSHSMPVGLLAFPRMARSRTTVTTTWNAQRSQRRKAR